MAYYSSLYEVLKVHITEPNLFKTKIPFSSLIVIKQSYHARYYLTSYHCLIFKIRQPPTFPQGRPCSILGRISLNRRVRDGYGCFPYPHRHRNIFPFPETS